MSELAKGSITMSLESSSELLDRLNKRQKSLLTKMSQMGDRILLVMEEISDVNDELSPEWLEFVKSYEGRWPSDLQSPTKLAKAGFIYTGKDDEVKCAYCDVKLKDWKEKDIPLLEHEKSNPNCPFLKWDMTMFVERLRSFKFKQVFNPWIMAKYGYFFAGNDYLECYSCKARLPLKATYPLIKHDSKCKHMATVDRDQLCKMWRKRTFYQELYNYVTRP